MSVVRHRTTEAAPKGTHYDHVLVPIDGSERSTIALRTGRELASRLDAALHTVSVAAHTTDVVRLGVAAAAALGVAPTDGRVHTVGSGDPATAIASVADGLSSCIVCMSTHAHDRVAGAVLGSTARELLQIRDRPVVMIGPLADRPVYMGDDWAEPFAVRRVVVCVDADHASSETAGSSASNSATTLVEIAADWAVALGMSLTILNIAAPHVSLTGSAGNDELEQWMTSLAAGVVREQLHVDTHVEVDPVGTTSGIRSYLATHPAGLLAVSTRARDGLDRLVHGATAAAITAASTIATLVVPIPRT